METKIDSDYSALKVILALIYSVCFLLLLFCKLLNITPISDWSWIIILAPLWFPFYYIFILVFIILIKHLKIK